MPHPIDQPGLFFVIATLLPLLSFTLLLILAAVRWTLRPYAKSNRTINEVFQALGGEVTGRGPAFIALGAIALAFVCSAVGFVHYYIEAHDLHEARHHVEQSIAAGKAKENDQEFKDDVHRLETLEKRWQDEIPWAHVAPTGLSDREKGTMLHLGFRIDMLAAVMFVMVTFVATLIHLFSIGYMSEELQRTVEDHEVHTAQGHYERRGRFGQFFMYLSLFCFSMLNLLLADNLFQVFVSWELVGICSFLLIGFYFERTSASNAANKAFITNRVGDAGFIIGLLIIWTYFGTFNFEEIFARLRCPNIPDAHSGRVTRIDGKSAFHRIVRANVEQSTSGAKSLAFKLDKNGESAILFPRKPNLGHFDTPDSKAHAVYVYDEPEPNRYGYIPYWMLVAAGLGIFLGCVGKSAQFPLQVWLPDAMEGPTPVSALIHAATMVAAGVYLVGRSYPLFTPEVLLTIAYVGAITLFVAATIAVVMTDIKKVLAYSTVSQLGFMMLALGVGAWAAGLLHLLTHAFFKALLFLGSGSVIYGCHHQQDMLKMGGLYSKMKITAITMLIGVLAISGIPLFSGWYSKDEVLVGALAYSRVNTSHFLLFLTPLVTAGITTFYMFRMWFMTFTGKPRDPHVHEHAHESPWMMTVPLVLLAILSVCVAWGWPLHEPDKSWLGEQLHHSQPETIKADMPAVVRAAADHENHMAAGALALGMVGIGLAFALILYFYGILDPAEAKEQFPGVHRFLTHKWYFDELYSAMIVRPGLTIASWCRNFDLKVIDGLLNFIGRKSVTLARWSGRFDKGIIDGLANLIADVSYDFGVWLRNFQTGYIRSYVLFLALAAIAIGIVLYAWANALGSGL